MAGVFSNVTVKPWSVKSWAATGVSQEGVSWTLEGVDSQGSRFGTLIGMVVWPGVTLIWPRMRSFRIRRPCLISKSPVVEMVILVPIRLMGWRLKDCREMGEVREFREFVWGSMTRVPKVVRPETDNSFK